MKLNRRSFVVAAAGLAAAPAFCRARSGGDRMFVAAGSVPGADVRGIYSAAFDPQTGVIGTPLLQADTPNPINIGLSPDGRHLYAGMSAAVQPGENSRISAYAVHGLTLHSIGTADAQGVGARDPRVTPDGKHLFHVNYETGEVVCSELTTDGAVGKATSVMLESGTGPVRPRQDKPHPHSDQLSPGGGFLIVNDLGADRFVVYRFERGKGRLQLHGAALAPPGSGPRYMAFHPSGRWLYSTNELGGGLNMFSWAEAGGKLVWLGVIQTTPPGFAGKNITADLALRPDGRFIYVSNRGHPSIAVYSIDSLSGSLSLQGHVTAPDEFSWYMTMHPGGRWLLVSGRITGAISALPIDPFTGKLGEEVSRVNLANPASIRFLAGHGPDWRDVKPKR